MNQPDDDTMRPEYDFSTAERGKHHRAFRRGTNLGVLEPDVAELFKDSKARQ